ncbi:hypothetical protein BC831DRAFT_285820 [Entophlyctis helioformis]|nr:hypothetical protein BC831DRAFT_285820 [Entophlyctis helioformis]
MSRDVLADASGSHQEGSLALASAPPVQPSAAPAATIPASAIPSAVAVSASHPTTTSVQFVQANDEEPAASLVTVVAFLRYVYRAYTCADETRAVSTESFSFVHEPSPVLNPAEYVTQDSYSSRINLAKALASKKDPSGDADKEQAGPLASSTIQNAANMISSALRGGMAKRDASASSSPNIMNPQQQDASRVGTAVGSESGSNISSGQPTTGAIASSIVSGAVKNMSSGVKSMSSGVRNMSSGLRSVFVSRANTYDALQPGDEPSPLTSPRSPQANVQDTEGAQAPGHGDYCTGGRDALP